MIYASIYLFETSLIFVTRFDARLSRGIMHEMHLRSYPLPPVRQRFTLYSI